MPNPQAGPDHFLSTTTDSRERESEILGAPPRLSPLRPEKCSRAQQQLIEQVGGAPSVAQKQRQSTDTDTEWVEILARHPDLFVAHLQLSEKFFAVGGLSPRDRELVVLRVAWLCQAPFEWGGHVQIGKGSGVTAEEIKKVIDGSKAAGWDKHCGALMRVVEELHYDSMITDETWADLSETLNDKQLIELIMLVGQYKTVAYYQNALRFRLPKGNDGLSAR